jgi:hypothetical protein
MPDAIRYHAVVTGDIVRSTRLSRDQFRQVQEAITRAGRELAQHFPGRIPFPIELFRGDSWQLFLPAPADALRMALYARAFVLAEAERVDTRFAIGVGTVDKMPEKSVGDGRGEAFRLSGDMVDRKRTARMSIAIAGPPVAEQENRAIATMLTVLDAVVSRWTSAQATAARGALLGWTQEQIAERWPGRSITQQAAGQHLSRAGFDGALEVIEYYEDVMKKAVLS